MTLDEFGRDQYVAEDVLHQLTTFPEKFRELGAAEELRRLVTTRKTLRGPLVGQAPEDFTEQFLVEPVLHALGYRDPTSAGYDSERPHFVRRPSTFHSVEERRPDYLLSNVAPNLVCFLETKAVNREQPSGSKTAATDRVASYLDSNTFCNAGLLAEPERRYLVGIGTDGFRWTMHCKDLETGQTGRVERKTDLSGTIESISRKTDALEGSPDDGDGDETHVARRGTLSDTFTPRFASHSLPGFARSLVT